MMGALKTDHPVRWSHEVTNVSADDEVTDVCLFTATNSGDSLRIVSVRLRFPAVVSGR